jgi:hypothetical protein
LRNDSLSGATRGRESTRTARKRSACRTLRAKRHRTMADSGVRPLEDQKSQWLAPICPTGPIAATTGGGWGWRAFLRMVARTRSGWSSADAETRAPTPRSVSTVTAIRRSCTPGHGGYCGPNTHPEFTRAALWRGTQQRTATRSASAQGFQTLREPVPAETP